MNQYLYDDDSLIAVFNSEKESTEYRTLLSRKNMLYIWE